MNIFIEEEGVWRPLNDERNQSYVSTDNEPLSTGAPSVGTTEFATEFKTLCTSLRTSVTVKYDSIRETYARTRKPDHVVDA